MKIKVQGFNPKGFIISKKRPKKGDTVLAKLGKSLPFSKAKVVKRRGKNVTITGVWGEGVTGTLDEVFVKPLKKMK